MIIYSEVLFLENFITGAVILALTGKICGKKAGKWRIMAGALMCGVYAFILFIKLNWLAALASKLIFSAVIALAVFGVSTLRAVFKAAGVFYIVSFLMGGITVSIMYMMEEPGITANGSAYICGLKFIQITAGVTVTWYLCSWLAVMLRDKMHKEKVLRTAELNINGHSWKMRALLDTGNFLKEPVSGLPVAVLSEAMGKEICRTLGSGSVTRTVVIPYTSVGNRGLMHGIRPDWIKVGNVKTDKIIIGIGEYDFSPWKGTEKYDLLLHQQLLEGEDLEYGQEYNDNRM